MAAAVRYLGRGKAMGHLGLWREKDFWRGASCCSRVQGGPAQARVCTGGLENPPLSGLQFLQKVIATEKRPYQQFHSFLEPSTLGGSGCRSQRYIDTPPATGRDGGKGEARSPILGVWAGGGKRHLIREVNSDKTNVVYLCGSQLSTSSFAECFVGAFGVPQRCRWSNLDQQLSFGD